MSDTFTPENLEVLLNYLNNEDRRASIINTINLALREQSRQQCASTSTTEDMSSALVETEQPSSASNEVIVPAAPENPDECFELDLKRVLASLLAGQDSPADLFTEYAHIIEEGFADIIGQLIGPMQADELANGDGTKIDAVKDQSQEGSKE